MSSDELLVGATLDRYELLAPIAEGGMGAVWLARVSGKFGFEKFFAVKTIRARFGREGAFRAMFLDEARIVSRIHSDHVVPVVDLGEQGGILYMVMDWVDGDSVAAWRRSIGSDTAALPPGAAVQLVLDACRGLDAAHRATTHSGEALSVVHRDVSPHNILVTRDGVAKLIDFGIAKAAERLSPESVVGTVKGKIHYMAPEQVRGGGVGPYTDVFALAAVAYQLFAGTVPFHSEAQTKVIARLLDEHEAPPLDPRFGANVSAALARALRKRIEERTTSVEAFRDAFEHAARADRIGFGREVLRAAAWAQLGAHRAARDDLMRRVREGLGAPPRPSLAALRASQMPPGRTGLETQATETYARGTPDAGVPHLVPLAPSRTSQMPPAAPQRTVPFAPGMGAPPPRTAPMPQSPQSPPQFAPAPAKKKNTSWVWLAASGAALTTMVLLALVVWGAFAWRARQMPTGPTSGVWVSGTQLPPGGGGASMTDAEVHAWLEKQPACSALFRELKTCPRLDRLFNEQLIASTRSMHNAYSLELITQPMVQTCVIYTQQVAAQRQWCNEPSIH